MQEMMPEYHKVDGREIEKRQGWWTGLEEIYERKCCEVGEEVFG